MKITPRPFPRRAAEKLIEFLPYFQENNTFKRSDLKAHKDTVYGIYDQGYSAKVNEFIEFCNSCFVAVHFDNRGDWELNDRSEELISNTQLIATIDLLTLRMLFSSLTNVKHKYSVLTMYILNADIIVCMLLRLEELIDEIPVVTEENEQWLDKIIAWANEKGIKDYHTTPKTLNTIWGGLPRDKELLLNSYTLQLGWNDIGELPKEIGNLSNLIELRLWCSKLTKLPKEIGNLVKLRELSLVENNLSCLPKEIGNLINLEVLWLDTNSIKKLPGEIGNLVKLRELRLTENNLSCLPKEIGNLTNLEELDLDDNPIKELPKEINNLHKLRVSGLIESGIMSVPEENCEMIKIDNMHTIKSPRGVLHNIFSYIGELPISGGWGYTKEEAVVINMHDPIVAKNVPFDGINIEYVFAKHRTYLELITMRREDDRFSGIEFETIRQELHQGANGKRYDRLILKVTALRNKDYKTLKEAWENNLDNENYNREAHWEQDKMLRIQVEREFWFEISSFYGQNFVVLDESDEDGGSATVQMK